jgi:hypothetical protein
MTDALQARQFEDLLLQFSTPEENSARVCHSVQHAQELVAQKTRDRDRRLTVIDLANSQFA